MSRIGLHDLCGGGGVKYRSRDFSAAGDNREPSPTRSLHEGESQRREDWEGVEEVEDGREPTQAELDNHANQLKPNSDAYSGSRGERKGSARDRGQG